MVGSSQDGGRDCMLALAGWLRGCLAPKDIPSHIGPELLAGDNLGDRLGTLAGQALDGGAVFSRHVSARLPHARSAGSDPDCGSQRGNASSHRNGSFQGGQFFTHERDYAPNTNVMQVRGLITSVKTLSERLKSAREAKGWTQATLAEKAKVSQGAIGNAEAKIRGRLRDIISVAKALDVNPEWLESGRGPREVGGAAQAPKPQAINGERHAAHAVSRLKRLFDLLEKAPNELVRVALIDQALEAAEKVWAESQDTKVRRDEAEDPPIAPTSRAAHKRAPAKSGKT
jgi:transcriptional regulator with XRE-family HTH domain